MPVFCACLHHHAVMESPRVNPHLRRPTRLCKIFYHREVFCATLLRTDVTSTTQMSLAKFWGHFQPAKPCSEHLHIGTPSLHGIKPLALQLRGFGVSAQRAVLVGKSGSAGAFCGESSPQQVRSPLSI
jgi:hypothetical protein